MEKKIQFLVRQWKGEAADPQSGQEYPLNDADVSEYSKLWDRAGNYKDNAFEPDVEANWQKFKAKIQTDHPESVDAPIRRLSTYWRYAAAAIVLLLGLWFVFQPNVTGLEETTVATNNQQTKKITLPDRSLVWLSKNSSIIFDKKLKKNHIRTVRLQGEAFFEVNADAVQPFQVETPHGLIEALGTSFNVRALSGEGQTEVQVVRGLVTLRKKERDKKLEVPAEFIGYIQADTGKLSKEIANSKNTFASTQVWRTNTINLETRTLGEAQEILRRYTDYRIEFSNPGMVNCIATWTLQLDQPEESLRLLEKTGIFRLQKTSKSNFRLVGKACPK
ncbi:FecR domain-containing protein [Haliscomenobacter sp.]|uniref:FecR family protein n=1 Tax=Haliscomenobacter sp. TaxID=2717303 RepID=UPI0033650DEE